MANQWDAPVSYMEWRESCSSRFGCPKIVISCFSPGNTVPSGIGIVRGDGNCFSPGNALLYGIIILRVNGAPSQISTACKRSVIAKNLDTMIA
jgi:hypothetical protein